MEDCKLNRQTNQFQDAARPEATVAIDGAAMTAERIADAIASDIRARRLQAGEVFPSERKLCDRFGVGRNVVREAMTILAERHLTNPSKGKRPRVVVPTLATIIGGMTEAAQYFFIGNEGKAHVEQARLFLETSLVRYAVDRITNAQVARMVSAIEECDANIADAGRFRRADVKFHRVLAEVPGNPIFIALHEAFVEKLMINRPVQENIVARNQVSNGEHKKLIEAILSTDSDAAVAILTRHLSRNYETYLLRSLSRAGVAGVAAAQENTDDQQLRSQNERVENETHDEADSPRDDRGTDPVRDARSVRG